MAKKYTGSLTLEWFNKNRSIITQKAEQKRESDIPAPRINWINKDEALFYEISEEEGKGLTPYWVDRNDIRVKESRPLVFQKAYKAVPEGDRFKVEESDIDDPEIDNILIKGDNLLALNTLKKMFDQKPDDEKVKCIYIDPPYNTGSAFENYDDNFAHSEWLTLMRDRLVVLKNILKTDGVIYVQLDNKEVHYFKILMDEIFGRDFFQREIIWHLNTTSGYKTKTENWVRDHDTILFYSKTENFFFKKLYKDYPDDYKARFKKKDEYGRPYRDDRPNGQRQYLDELKGIRIGDVWNDIMSFQQASTSAEYLKFDGQKPERLIQRIFEASTVEEDIVLDCFCGTGTTLATAHKMKRRWVGVEIGNQVDDFIINRVKKIIEGIDQSGISQEENWKGGGSFKYYHLGESIIATDKDGYGDFNWSLGRDFIEKSLLATYDFNLDENFTCPASTIENPPKVGFYTVNNYTMAGVVSLSSPTENYEALDNDYISELIALIRKEKSPQSITIFTNRGVEMAWESKPEDVEIIKVPHAIFAELER